MKRLILVALCLIATSSFAEVRDITIVNHQYEGTKQWVPGTIVVKKGDEVNLTLINNTPSGVHNFSIPAFEINQNVLKGKKAKLSFKADKAGIHQIKCGLHKAHVGGQFIVLE